MRIGRQQADDERRQRHERDGQQQSHLAAGRVADVAKEQARVVLPEGLIKSRLYMNGTVRSWIHFIELRSANGTQKECSEVAIACAEAISKIFPMVKEFCNE